MCAYLWGNKYPAAKQVARHCETIASYSYNYILLLYEIIATANLKDKPVAIPYGAKFLWWKILTNQNWEILMSKKIDECQCVHLPGKADLAV